LVGYHYIYKFKINMRQFTNEKHTSLLLNLSGEKRNSFMNNGPLLAANSFINFIQNQGNDIQERPKIAFNYTFSSN
jgi:hypothetical protein